MAKEDRTHKGEGRPETGRPTRIVTHVGARDASQQSPTLRVGKSIIPADGPGAREKIRKAKLLTRQIGKSNCRRPERITVV